MSEENVELVRWAYEVFNREAFNRDDRGAFEGLLVANLAPEFEYVPTGAVPGLSGRYEGVDGFLEFVDTLFGEFENVRIEINELIDLGDQVLASITQQGRGRQSGVEVNWAMWQLWTAKDGKATRLEGFTSKAEALEAAGLSE
jgi:ketosteroid isomerase-like protein